MGTAAAASGRGARGRHACQPRSLRPSPDAWYTFGAVTASLVALVVLGFTALGCLN